MHELSKFQITTIIFLLMFVFVIGAIYTNTKEAADKKLNANNNALEQKNAEEFSYEQNEILDNNAQIKNITSQIDALNQQISEIKNIQQQNRLNIQCQIYGIATPNGILRLAPEEAFAQARDNGNDLIMSCSF